MGKPEHILGLPWNADAARAWASLGLECAEWRPWHGDLAFFACVSRPDEAQAFGFPATLTFFAAEGRLEGAALAFRDCAGRWPKLRAAVVEEYQLEDSGDPIVYERWQSGEVVRLAHDEDDDTCRLVVAGPRFGHLYSREVLRRGLGEATRGLRP